MAPKVATLAKLERDRLELEFFAAQKSIEHATNSLRWNHVQAGQILLKLQTGLKHGEWLRYLGKLCAECNVGQRTARRYMADALKAEKIPADILAEVERRGIKLTREVRDTIIEELTIFPDQKCEANVFVENVLRAFVPPKPISPEEKTERDARRKRQKAEDARQKAERDTGAHRVDDVFRQEREQIEPMARELIETGYRELAKRYHPDAGGTHEQFILLKEAHELLRKWLGANTRTVSAKVA